MNEDAARLLAKAGDELETSRVLLREARLSGAVGRAYFAMFHAARAMLASVGSEPRSHQGVQHLFWETFGATGEVPAELAQWLTRAANLRLLADYGLDFDPEFGSVEELIDRAADFVRIAEAYLIGGC